MVARQPNLLMFAPATLGAKLAFLASTWGMLPARAVRLVIQHPVLLTHSTKRYQVGRD